MSTCSVNTVDIVDLKAAAPAYQAAPALPGAGKMYLNAVNLPDRTLRLALAATLTLAGLRLTEVPGADLMILVTVAASAVLLLVLAVRKLLRGSARPKQAAVEAGTTRTSGR